MSTTGLDVAIPVTAVAVTASAVAATPNTTTKTAGMCGKVWQFTCCGRELEFRLNVASVSILVETGFLGIGLWDVIALSTYWPGIPFVLSGALGAYFSWKSYVLDGFETLRKKLAEENEKLQIEIQTIKSQMEAEVAKLNGQITQFRGIASTLREAGQKIAADEGTAAGVAALIGQDARTLEGDITLIQTTLASANAREEGLRTTLASLQTQKAKLEEDLVALQGTQARFAANEAMFKDDNAALARELESLKAAHLQTQEDLRRSQQSLDEARTELAKEERVLSATAEAFQKDEQTLHADVASLSGIAVAIGPEVQQAIVTLRTIEDLTKDVSGFADLNVVGRVRALLKMIKPV